MKRNKNMSDDKYMDLLEYYVRSRKVLMIFAVPFFIILAIVICAVFPQCWWLCFVSLFFGGCSVAAYLVAKHYLKKEEERQAELKKGEGTESEEAPTADNMPKGDEANGACGAEKQEAPNRAQK